MNTKDVGLLALGVSLGAAVGLLCAPRSGKVTRRFVRLKANSAKSSMRDRGLEIRRSALSRVERASQSIKDAKANLAAAVEAGKEAYREANVG
jgi:gas vesicle protein